MIDLSYNPASEREALKIANEELLAIRKTHNDTYIGKTCFVKCFGNKQRFDSELLGARFAIEKSIGVDILDIDYQNHIIKYDIAKPSIGYNLLEMGKQANILHNSFKETDKLINWQEVNEIRGSVIHRYCPEFSKEYLELTDYILENTSDWVAIHSDLSPHNIVEYRNRPIFVDWEWLTYGPREWDFLSVILNQRRHGINCNLMEMILGYENQDNSYKINKEMIYKMYRLKEFQSITYSIEIGERNENYKKQAQQRIESIKNNVDMKWIIHGFSEEK